MQNKIKWYLVAFLMIVGTSQVFGKEGVKPVNVVISLVEKNQWRKNNRRNRGRNGSIY